MIEYVKEWEECQFCERTYFEYDTGYSEYECMLDGKGCCGGGEDCPLSFKYKIEKEN